MKSKNFNLIASAAAFILGGLYVFSDGASINANVIGASGSDAGLVSIVGIVMVIGAIGLFISSMEQPTNHGIALERLVHETKNTESINKSSRVRNQKDEEYERILKEEKR